MVVLVQHAQVESQQRYNDSDEDKPDPGWLAQEVGCEEGNQDVDDEYVDEEMRSSL